MSSSRSVSSSSAGGGPRPRGGGPGEVVRFLAPRLPESQLSPSRRDPEIVAEQAYLDAVYDRLEAMRVSASSVADAYSDVRRGGTRQARLERDIAVETTHRRLAALDIGDTPLCFGRLDLTEGNRFYVGRLGVGDAAHTPPA